MTEASKATPLLIIVSILVIAFSLMMVSVAISSCFVSWDPCSMIGGVILLPIPLMLVVQQYRGTFRRVRSAASCASIVLFLIGGLAVFMFVTTLFEIVVAGAGLFAFAILVPILVIATLFALSGWVNLTWRDTLPVEGGDANWTFSLQEFLSFVAIICCFTALTSSFIRSTPPRYAENVSVAEAPFGLPTNATDVSFCQGFRGTIAYEFTINETSFREWVEEGIGSIESNSSNATLQSITGRASITRYNRLSSELHGPDSVVAHSGLEYSWSFEDRGVYAIFDSESNRAYYYAHFH